MGWWLLSGHVTTGLGLSSRIQAVHGAGHRLVLVVAGSGGWRYLTGLGILYPARPTLSAPAPALGELQEEKLGWRNHCQHPQTETEREERREREQLSLM